MGFRMHNHDQHQQVEKIHAAHLKTQEQIPRMPVIVLVVKQISSSFAGACVAFGYYE